MKQNTKHDDFVPVSAGIFWIGNYDNKCRELDTTQLIALTRDILVCDHPVTQAEYAEVGRNFFQFRDKENPSQYKGKNLPVECVSLLDAIEYCNLLSIGEGLTPCYSGRTGWFPKCNFNANGYRLPTSAEWTRAAGLENEFHLLKNRYKKDKIPGGSWIHKVGPTHEVKSGEPNSKGIYDMYDNVFELCWDAPRENDSIYSKNAAINPVKNRARGKRGYSDYDFMCDTVRGRFDSYDDDEIPRQFPMMRTAWNSEKYTPILNRKDFPLTGFRVVRSNVTFKSRIKSIFIIIAFFFLCMLNAKSFLSKILCAWKQKKRERQEANCISAEWFTERIFKSNNQEQDISVGGNE